MIGSQPVHESVEFLLEHRPPGLRLVLASRADPPLALARLRARGQLAELRAAELRFTAGEAGGAAAARRPGPAPARCGRGGAGGADRGVGGRAAAGRPVAARPADVAGFVAAFTGSHRYVLDYLAEEVLERQPEQVRTFLLETSVLERLVGRAVRRGHRPRPAARRCWSRSSGPGLFLVPLDEVRGWWRYHHLFADLLRARLQQEQPGRVRAAAPQRRGLV